VNRFNHKSPIESSIMKKQATFPFANRRQFLRAGLIGGMGLAFSGILKPTALWANYDFTPLSDSFTGTHPSFSWQIELDGNALGDSVMVTADLFDSNGNWVDTYPMQLNGGNPYNVPANGVVQLSVGFDDTTAGSNLPCAGSVLCSGIKKDHSLACPNSISCSRSPHDGLPPCPPAAAAIGPPKHSSLSIDIVCKRPARIKGFPHAWQIPVVLSTNRATRMRVIYHAFFSAPNGISGGLPVSPRHRMFDLTGPAHTHVPTVDATAAAALGADVIFAAFAMAQVPGEPVQSVSDRTIIQQP
jgi:hypothetical protein